MTDFDYGAFLAELEAITAAAESADPAIDRELLDDLNAIRRLALPVEPRPDIVADAVPHQQQNRQGNKVSANDSIGAGQYAGNTTSQVTVPQPFETEDHTTVYCDGCIPSSHTPSSCLHGNRESVAWRIATRRAQMVRKPRQAAARLDVVAMHKTWDGTKSKGRRDRVNEAEKLSAAVWHTAAANGLAVSLNLGIRRGSMLLNSADPKRRITQNLSRRLSAVGLGDLPYAFVFELTPERDGGRLHVHGVIDTSGLAPSDVNKLHDVLVRSASVSTGAIGGQRQLVLAPLYDPAGWADYLLKDVERTSCKLGVGDPFMISKPMRRMAKTYFGLIRSEMGNSADTAMHPRLASIQTASGAHRHHRQGFTVRSCSDTRRLSGERDKTSVGGVRRQACHRPHGPQTGRLGRGDAGKRSTALS